jgi:MFS family permease
MGALRERNFRLYFVGQAASAIGNAMVPVALAFAVLNLTHSASDLGFVLTSYAISQLIFLLAGGVVADRVPRRLALLGSDVVRFAAEAVLAALLLSGRPPLIAVLVLVFVQGAASALFLPASTGIVPALVDDDHLQAANSLLQLSRQRRRSCDRRRPRGRRWTRLGDRGRRRLVRGERGDARDAQDGAD